MIPFMPNLFALHKWQLAGVNSRRDKICKLQCMLQVKIVGRFTKIQCVRKYQNTMRQKIPKYNASENTTRRTA